MSRLKISFPVMMAIAVFLMLAVTVVLVKYAKYLDLLESMFSLMIPIMLYAVAAYIRWDVEQSRVRTEKKIEQIEVKAEQEPDKTKFAWDLARVKLEAYFDRNLSQVRMIFFVAVAVMVVGFAFVMWGVTLAISKPEYIKTSYVAAISGIITEFIGVTFMVIYRSTMAQANQFMDVLERINTVGMAVQILDAIPESNAELKNSTRAEIVSLLLSANTMHKAVEVRRKAKAVSVT